MRKHLENRYLEIRQPASLYLSGYMVRLLTRQIQELPHRLSGHRVAQARRNLGQRLEHELPVAEPRMRHDQSGFVHDLIAEQHEVEVARPRGPPKRPLAPAVAFDTEELGKKLRRRHRC